ncbi:MAG: hypothetical protein JW795_17470 [Chitinivibrionales bacterium]|nr:hypothetical protein [Chitinivibrionales bacterium]
MLTIAEKWLQQGIEKGIEKGFDDGFERRGIEVAERMIEKGMSNGDIRDITGLSIKKIEEIRQKCRKK